MGSSLFTTLVRTTPLSPITATFALHLRRQAWDKARPVEDGNSAGGPGRRSRHSRATGSALDEGEKVGIDHVGVRRAHAVRKLLVDLQLALLEELGGKRRGLVIMFMGCLLLFKPG